MLLKKTAWFWKSGLAAISFMLIVSVSPNEFERVYKRTHTEAELLAG